MCRSETRAYWRNCQVGGGRIYGLFLRDGGGDTWAALAVLALKKENPALKLQCILPCEGQADKWSASARELYFSILEQSDEVVYVSRE